MTEKNEDAIDSNTEDKSHRLGKCNVEQADIDNRELRGNAQSNLLNNDYGNQKSANQDYQRQLVAKIFNMRPRVHMHHDAGGLSEPIQSETDTQTGLNVYINNFIENGIRALSITFPTVEGLIGEDSFRILSRKLLRHEAKASFDWAKYGITLPTFIESQKALEAYPFLSEVAELDWAIHCIEREADKKFEPSTFASLESGDTSLLRFIAAPGLQTRSFWFPVADLYRLIHEPYLQSEEGVLARKEVLKNITESINNAINMTTPRSVVPRSLVLWRAEYKAQFEYLSDAEAQVIQNINEQASVDAVIETISTHDIDLVAWLTKAISNKLIFAVV